MWDLAALVLLAVVAYAALRLVGDLRRTVPLTLEVGDEVTHVLDASGARLRSAPNLLVYYAPGEHGPTLLAAGRPAAEVVASLPEGDRPKVRELHLVRDADHAAAGLDGAWSAFFAALTLSALAAQGRSRLVRAKVRVEPRLADPAAADRIRADVARRPRFAHGDYTVGG